MNRQPDKLFRDKLEGYRPAVSAEAWTRVSANLAGQTNWRLWLKFAAGVVLLAAAGIVIFTIEKSAPSALAVKEPPNSTQTESATTQKSNTAQKQPAENEKVNAAPSDIAQGERKKAGKSTTEKSQGDPPMIEKKVIESDVAALETPRVQLPEETEDKESLMADQSVAPNERSEQKNITLVFTAQEVDEKYLKKENAVAEATSEEKETSTWRKVLDKAHDLKHNQDPLGDLRQKKNEILALNFKTNEQSHENQ